MNNVIDLEKKRGMRSFADKLINMFVDMESYKDREPPNVIELSPANGLKRNDDCHYCGECGSPYFFLRRNGEITCSDCGEVMHARWFEPDDDDPGEEAA